MIFNIEQVKAYLPHRDPFLFVDSISELTMPEGIQMGVNLEHKYLVGAGVVGHYRTRAEHAIFKGHFPEHPIFPGVLQIEMMAQVSSFVTALSQGGRIDKMKLDVALVGVERTRFRKSIYPEFDLTIKSRLTKVRGIFSTYEAQIFCGNELMSESSFLATLKIINL
ncbi:MAG: beta-hydroxyacyl-ACP dehydratase [Bacteriovoracaceae bacterium]|nr:beta-hydroxyacyl-ACP dehydratase [Bacteriovoracaceae bacterium]